MTDDLLSDVLAMVRLTGALIFRVSVQGPWCISAGATAAHLAPALPAGANHLIAFHIVLEGRCWVRHAPGAWEAIDAGDAVVFPHGGAHDIGDHRDDAPVAFTTVLGERALLDVRELRFDTGRGAPTSVLCGFLGCDRNTFTPLFAALPSQFVTRLNAGAAALVDYAVAEALSDHPGSRGLRLRMAELLFLDALRSFMRELPDEAAGWLAGLRDPIVGRALQLMHADPIRAWAVATLAREVACSRSILAQRFKAITGQAPMHYLTQLRMQRAAQQLAYSRSSVDAVAEDVGYASSAAFQRAFKRCHGMPPARWRRQMPNQ